MAGIMMSVTREQFQELRRHLRSITKTCLRDTYGISEGTWTRMRDGIPIRVSTFTRMMARYERHLARLDPVAAAAVRARRPVGNAERSASAVA